VKAAKRKSEVNQREIPEASENLKILEQVDNLNAEVKTLALNLALYLAKARAGSEKQASCIDRLEPEFIRLVNGTVKVVQELTLILDASRNLERGQYEIPSGESDHNILELRLQDILRQCSHLLGLLNDQGKEQQ